MRGAFAYKIRKNGLRRAEIVSVADFFKKISNFFEKGVDFSLGM